MKKFVMSYSFGKDSTLCIDRMISKGYEPIALLVMVNELEDRSYFHGVNSEMMEGISKSLDIPIIMGKSKGEDYKDIMVEKLKEAKKLGAEIAVFGDIDIADHYEWCSQRCMEASIDYEFPLWQEKRADIVHEILSKGYKCVIKAIENGKLPPSVLGKVIDDDMLEVFKNYNVDLCGENGEYHTVVVDGPIFNKKIEYIVNDIIELERNTVADLLLA